MDVTGSIWSSEYVGARLSVAVPDGRVAVYETHVSEPTSLREDPVCDLRLDQRLGVVHTEHADRVTATAIIPSDRGLLLGFASGKIALVARSAEKDGSVDHGGTTAAGSASAYEWIVATCHAPPTGVTALATDAGGLTLYSTGNDLQIVKTTRTSGSNLSVQRRGSLQTSQSSVLATLPSRNPPTAVALSPCESMLAVASCSVHIFSTKDGTHLKHFIGHENAVHSLFFMSSNSQWLVSAAQNDRYVSMWHCANEKHELRENMHNSSKRSKHASSMPVSLSSQATTTALAPKRTYLAREPVQSLLMNPFCGSDEGSFAAVDVRGGVSVWRVHPLPSLAGAEKQSEGPHVNHAPHAPSSLILAGPDGVILYGLFASVSHLVLISGSAFVPISEVVNVNTAGPLVSLNDSKAKDGSSQTLKGAENGSTAEGRDERRRHAESRVPLVDHATIPLPASRSAGRGVIEADAHAREQRRSAKADHLEMDEEDRLDNEPTLQERLTKMGVRGPTPALTSDLENSGEAALGPDARESGIHDSVDSVASLLQQALDIKDAKLLEKALQASTSSRVVARTVANLEMAYVVPLLEAIVDRLRSRYRRTDLLAWLSALVTERAGVLASSVEAAHALAAFSQVSDERAQRYTEFEDLEGRLDFTLRASEHRIQEPFHLREPIVLYDETVMHVASDGEAEPESESEPDTHLYERSGDGINKVADQKSRKDIVDRMRASALKLVADENDSSDDDFD
ncbi:WD repeat-containing protein 43 [Porphyridium purpureum]|uniref:WD repeat-containing protein 43 n=1 Tax=Porphyridium purpureum TaxID=35688 RepID=A0A5J4YMW5_PORPP|nr:WD repeat-containing protein 43 [Porphyridium purpureum]|eukprot:POR7141..scf222_8